MHPDEDDRRAGCGKSACSADWICLSSESSTPSSCCTTSRLYTGNSASRALRSLAKTAGLGYAIPSLKRSPYDDFMMRFHNFLKENASFQAECRKEYLQFPAGSSWMVYTDMVPHAVLSGQYALEQTFLVEHGAMVSPESSPLSVLEAMTHSALV